ncbi:hypothetical protein ACM26V_23105 [Salipaludibacillus sp. HK11]
MAIIYICKHCNGVGRVDSKLWFVTKKVPCGFCAGKGKKKYVKKKVV